jgi:O-antigen/teichoic acid export membrane protein
MTATLARPAHAAPVAAAPEPARTIATRTTLLAMSASVVGALSYGCTLLLTNALAPAEFAIFAGGQMILTTVGTGANALVPMPLARELTAAGADTARDRRAVGFAAALAVVAGLVAAVVATLIACSFADLPDAVAIGASALALCLLTPALGWLQGRQRFGSYAAVSVAQVVVRTGASAVLCLVFGFGAMAGLVAFAVGALSVLMAVLPGMAGDLRFTPALLRDRTRWRFTTGTAATLVTTSSLVGADVVIAAALGRGDVATSGFQALSTLSKGPVFLAAGTVLVVLPALGRGADRDGETVRVALRSFCRIAFLAAVVIATAPAPLVSIMLPHRYETAIPLLPALAVSGLAYSVIVVLSAVLLGLGAHGRVAASLVFASAVIPAAAVMGWQADGVRGLAVWTAAASVAAALAQVVAVADKLPNGTALPTLVIAAVAAAEAAALTQLERWPLLWVACVIAAAAATLGAPRLRRRPSARPAATPHRSLGTESDMASTLIIPRQVGPPTWADRTEPLPVVDPPTVAIELPTEPIPIVRPNVQASVWRSWWALAALATTLTGAAAAMRLWGLRTANELFVDEITYAQLGSQVALGHLPSQDGRPFFLHPPGSFVINAVVIRVWRLSGSLMDLVYDLRFVGAALGSLTVLLCFVILLRTSSVPAAVIGAAVVAVDPFVLRNNSRVMIETPATVFLLIGFLVLLLVVNGGRARRIAGELAAGLALGAAIVCKDMTVVPALVTVVAAALWRRTLPWAAAARITAAAFVPYTLYLTLLATQGLLPQWIGAKTSGIRRMLGIEQSTGFNNGSTGNLGSRLLAEVLHFGTSYALIASGFAGGVALALSRNRGRRLIGLLSASTGALGLYSALFGTLEEQFGYYVAVTSLLAVATLAWRAAKRWRRAGVAILVGSLLFASTAAFMGVSARLVQDDGYLHLAAWLDTSLPAGSRVGLTSPTAELTFLPRPGFEVWPSLASLSDNHADYVITSQASLEQGYGYASPRLLGWLEDTATPVVSFAGPSNGQLTVWHLDQEALAAAIARGETIPPVSGGYS